MWDSMWFTGQLIVDQGIGRQNRAELRPGLGVRLFVGQRDLRDVDFINLDEVVMCYR